MHKLMRYIKGYEKQAVLAPLFKMLEATFELFVPLVMAAVIDVGIAQKDRPYIVKMCFVLIALGIIGLVCSITAQYFAAKAASGFATGVRHALLEHIEEYISTGGYEALEKVLFEMTPQEVVEEISASNLRGRGGGGFPTGYKWSQVARQEEKTRYVVCNGDEGDPGAFMAAQSWDTLPQHLPF